MGSGLLQTWSFKLLTRLFLKETITSFDKQLRNAFELQVGELEALAQ